MNTVNIHTKLVVVGAVLGLAYAGYRAIQAIKREVKVENLTYDRLSRDSTLIVNGELDHMKLIVVANIEGREPFSAYSLDSNYEISINQIPLAAGFTLKEGLRVARKNEVQSTGVWYFPYNLRDRDYINIRTRPLHPVSRVLMTLAGDSISSVANDSLVSYTLFCSTFSIKYEENGPIDIICTGDERLAAAPTPFPIGLLLLKRGNNLYLFTIVSRQSGERIPIDLLQSIVHGS